MKIRSDYVSNSSSSSFMIVGISVERDELLKIAQRSGYQLEDGESWDDEDLDIDAYDVVEFIEGKFNLRVESGIENFYDCFCIGLNYEDMMSDETKGEFEERIGKTILEMTGEERKVEAMTDGGMEN